MEVRGGDYPYSESGAVSIAVVLSGVSNVPRIEHLQQMAVETQENIEEIREEQTEQNENLIDNDELDSLF
jgi:hypothetical protein